MLAYDEALTRLLALAPARSREWLAPAESLGRLLAAPVHAVDALPPFDNSAMDGFALHLPAGGAEAGQRFDVAGAQFAGDGPQARTGEAIEITTGAPLPAGFDAVVPLEQVVQEGASIVLHQAVAAGQHIRRCGEDVAVGDALLADGRQIDVPALAILSALGVTRLAVARRPRLGLIATGRELVDDPALPLLPGQIRNSNRPTLAARIAEAGAELVHAETVGDEVDALLAAIARARGAGAELLLSTGAVSMGRHDFVPATLRQLGADIVFHKLRMRPGKPLLAARLADGTPYLGLPGNPVSSAVGFRFFVEPLLRRWLGLADEVPATLPLANPLPARGGFRFHLKARCELGTGGAVRVRVLAGQESFRIAPLLAANAWAILPEDSPDLAAGASIEVVPPCHLHSLSLLPPLP